jgi:hypothetical protein
MLLLITLLTTSLLMIAAGRLEQKNLKPRSLPVKVRKETYQ